MDITMIEELVLGENETLGQWLLTLIIGYIVAYFIVYLFDLDRRLEQWADYLRQRFNIP